MNRREYFKMDKFFKYIVFPAATLISFTVDAAQQMYYIHSDHLNTPQALTDNNQQVVWKVEQQTPFGEVEVDQDPDGDSEDVVFNLRFPGQYYDEETNTNYNYFRTYDPSLGRYIQSDPIGLHGGMNTYAYVDANPVINTDSLGLFYSTFNSEWIDHPGRPIKELNPRYNPPNGGGTCRFKCNVKPQIICTGIGVGASTMTSPVGGVIAGGTCVLVKGLFCEKICEDECSDGPSEPKQCSNTRRGVRCD